MKIWQFSDLHLEYQDLPKLDIPEADVCVAAGDIMDKGVLPSLRWLSDNIAHSMPVIFVPGNHEFYRASLMDSLKAAREAADEFPNIHLLNDRSFTLDGVLFAGGTLWSDFALHGDARLAGNAAKDKHTGMNDYKKIKWQSDPWFRFTPERALALHGKTKAFLRNALEAHSGKSVVVTHHAPSAQSLDPTKASEIISAAYASHMDAFILETKPTVWMHGHIHQSVRYTIGETLIISNPRGYGDNEPGSSFNPGLIVEI